MNAAHTGGAAPDGVLDSTTRYTIEPRPTISTGTGATATATINGAGTVTALTLTNAGSGYTHPPVVEFTGSNTIPAAASATVEENEQNNYIYTQ